jgi:D-inositol-3-phosphate glycosyltransferase
MSRLVSAPAYRDRLGAAAALHARGFAWERTADLTLDVYRKAAHAMRHDLFAGALHG